MVKEAARFRTPGHSRLALTGSGSSRNSRRGPKYRGNLTQKPPVLDPELTSVPKKSSMQDKKVLNRVPTSPCIVESLGFIAGAFTPKLNVIQRRTSTSVACVDSQVSHPRSDELDFG